MPEITVKLSVEEAYALRDFVVRASDRDIETILGETHRHSRAASEARYKLSSAIYAAIGSPCGECGGPESDHIANYYCPEYRARRAALIELGTKL